MGWSIGFDSNWDRDIGYGVPAVCDHPDCNRKIDRGLSFVCGGAAYGGERGCGLFFCSKHLHFAEHLPGQFCDRCHPRKRKPFDAKPDSPRWIRHKLRDPSWLEWRKENPALVKELRCALHMVAA